MSLPVLAIVVLVTLALSYRFYGGFIARQYALGDKADTPAHRHNDGVDFVPTKPFYLFGQHFSAIAAAGPIVGPILACQQFGWLPSILWIGVGVVFIGAVHDFTTLIASVRHEAMTVAEVVKANLGRRSWLAILAFMWLALIYVIVAFVDVTASTFVTGDADTKGLDFRFNQGGAVAMSSLIYLTLSLVMGALTKTGKLPLWLMTVIFVPAAFGAVWLGTELSTVLIFSWRTWAVLIIGYCFVASLTPMWLLMQPRGYLGGFVLYAALAVGTLGIFLGGFDIKQPAFVGFTSNGVTLFPFLFVTIACGACSGFHGLVCSGTTSKQIDRERDCHPIGYGAMLLEAFVALIALATIMIVAPADTAGKPPGAIYAMGIGAFLNKLFGMAPMVAATFGAMALSTFIFDTLDSATRLGRYILQELAGTRSRASAIIGTLITCAVPLLFLVVTKTGAYRVFWTLFGSSNQLLAALSLLAVTMWMRRMGRRTWYTFYPMLAVMAVTLTSLVLQARELWRAAAGSTLWINALVSVLLIGLAAVLMVDALRARNTTSVPGPAE